MQDIDLSGDLTLILLIINLLIGLIMHCLNPHCIYLYIYIYIVADSTGCVYMHGG